MQSKGQLSLIERVQDIWEESQGTGDVGERWLSSQRCPASLQRVDCGGFGLNEGCTLREEGKQMLERMT